MNQNLLNLKMNIRNNNKKNSLPFKNNSNLKDIIMNIHEFVQNKKKDILNNSTICREKFRQEREIKKKIKPENHIYLNSLIKKYDFDNSIITKIFIYRHDKERYVIERDKALLSRELYLRSLSELL